MSEQFMTLEGLDANIEKARAGAIALASKVKELRVRIRDRLLASGTDKQARELRSQLAELSADQAFSEEHLAALHERRAQLAADKAAKEAAAEKRAKIDAFKALVAKRDATAEKAEAAASQLGQAVRDLTALTTDIRIALPTVGLPRNAVDYEAIRYGVEGSLFFAGMSWLFPEKPMPKYDAQGNLVSNIEERIKRADAGLLSMLPED